MTDIVKLYNPANAGSLTPEEIAGLQNLTSPQIKELALAFPNMVMQRAYLLIIDSRKPADKQLPSLSTYENLWNLREKNGLKSYVAFNFKGSYKAKTIQPIKPNQSQVVDLSDVELMSLPGFKAAGKEVTKETKVPVKKINKKLKIK